MIVGLVLAASACLVVLLFSRNGPEFPMLYVGVIAGVQLSVMFTTIPQQILYWQYQLSRMLHIEVSFWAFLACIATITWWFKLQLSAIFLLVVACCAARLLLYIGAAVMFAGPRVGRAADRT
jgi:hypothetical protein